METEYIFINTPGELDAKRRDDMCYFCRSCVGYSESGYSDIHTYNDECNSKAHRLHFGCFICKIGWKTMNRPDVYTDYNQHLTISVPANVKCPHCGEKAKYLGYNCRVPKKTDIKGWKELQKVLENDPLAFEAKCKCKSKNAVALKTHINDGTCFFCSTIAVKHCRKCMLPLCEKCSINKYFQCTCDMCGEWYCSTQCKDAFDCSVCNRNGICDICKEGSCNRCGSRYCRDCRLPAKRTCC